MLFNIFVYNVNKNVEISFSAPVHWGSLWATILATGKGFILAKDREWSFKIVLKD